VIGRDFRWPFSRNGDQLVEILAEAGRPKAARDGRDDVGQPRRFAIRATGGVLMIEEAFS
jgi:hypothetical protein